MDIRLEVLRIDGVWKLTSSGAELTPFGSEPEAVLAAIQAARRHHDQTGGTAVVHVWHGPEETAVFSTGPESSGRDSH